MGCRTRESTREYSNSHWSARSCRTLFRSRSAGPQHRDQVIGGRQVCSNAMGEGQGSVRERSTPDWEIGPWRS
jgi:hypothetical protein